MSQKIQRKQTKTLPYRDGLILSVLLLALSLWPQPKIAQAQWQSGTDMYNLNTGNVGIGSGSSFTPAEKLDVRGNLNLGTVGLTSTLKIYSSAAGGTGSYGRILTRPSGGLEIIGGGGSAATENALYVTANEYPGVDDTYSLGSTSLRFSSLYIGTGTSSFAGNVGIGTTNPGADLHVRAKTVGANVGLVIENDGTTTGIQSLILRRNLSDQAVISNTPGGGGNGLLISQNHVSGAIKFATGATPTERMRISSTGYVGIGTSTPQTNLHVFGTDYPWFMLDGNGSSGQSFLSMRVRTDANPNSEIYFNSAGNLIINSQAYANRGTPSGEVPRFTITGSGLVGIGTASPTAKLDVVGLNNGSSVRFTANTNADVAGLVFTVPTVTNWSLGNRPSGAFVLNNGNIFAGTDLVTVLPGGNVGIGTTGPFSKLQVSRPVTNTVLTADSSNTAGIVVAGNDSLVRLQLGVGGNTLGPYGGWIQASYDNGGASNGIKPLLLNPNGGNVGIGTTTPDSTTKLHVAGDVRIDGNIAAKYQDVAEWVTSPKSISSGTVVILDIDHSNQVLPSVRSYDTRVAGVISEMPGIILGESGDGKVKVATTGRVKVKVDATKKPVQVGDLLVTSDKEGVAMKSEPMEINGRSFHQPGTILGKALEPLGSGEGEVLVLLSLQ